ncbi:MAG: hypothetical protein Q7R93_05430 [bacterium]|nr:hypothetical protein [bacterium]
MTTVINTPPTQESSDSGVGILLGVIVGLVLIALFFVYALPAIRGTEAQKSDSIDVNIKLPGDASSPSASGGGTTGTN